jgi:hypothetical protein
MNSINKSYVYLITDGRYYKIGKSLNPFRRLKQLQTANPLIDLIGYTKRYSEIGLHAKFKKWRIAGEWFDLPKTEVENLIQNMHKPVRSYKKKISIANSMDLDTYVIQFGRYKGRMLNTMISDDEIEYIRKQIKSLSKKSKTRIMFNLWYNHYTNKKKIDSL